MKNNFKKVKYLYTLFVALLTLATVASRIGTEGDIRKIFKLLDATFNEEDVSILRSLTLIFDGPDGYLNGEYLHDVNVVQRYDREAASAGADQFVEYSDTGDGEVIHFSDQVSDDYYPDNYHSYHLTIRQMVQDLMRALAAKPFTGELTLRGYFDTRLPQLQECTVETQLPNQNSETELKLTNMEVSLASRSDGLYLINRYSFMGVAFAQEITREDGTKYTDLFNYPYHTVTVSVVQNVHTGEYSSTVDLAEASTRHYFDNEFKAAIAEYLLEYIPSIQECHDAAAEALGEILPFREFGEEFSRLLR